MWIWLHWMDCLLACWMHLSTAHIEWRREKKSNKKKEEKPWTSQRLSLPLPLPFEKQTFLKSDCQRNWKKNHIIYETICLDWFYHLSCTYACSQSSLQRISTRQCTLLHVYSIHQNDNRLHFQTFATNFLFLFFISVVRACLRICVRVVFFVALIDNRLLGFSCTLKNEIERDGERSRRKKKLNASNQMLHIFFFHHYH